MGGGDTHDKTWKGLLSAGCRGQGGSSICSGPEKVAVPSPSRGLCQWGLGRCGHAYMGQVCVCVRVCVHFADLSGRSCMCTCVCQHMNICANICGTARGCKCLSRSKMHSSIWSLRQRQAVCRGTAGSEHVICALGATCMLAWV